MKGLGDESSFLSMSHTARYYVNLAYRYSYLLAGLRNNQSSTYGTNDNPLQTSGYGTVTRFPIHSIYLLGGKLHGTLHIFF